MGTNRHPRMKRLIASGNAFFLGTAATVFFFYYSIMLTFSRSLLADPDTLWHIRTGQWILDHAQVPTVDFYSYTAMGKRWISTEWLSEIFYAMAYKIGEWRGVVILSAMLCATIIAILCFYLVRHLRFSVAIGWTALTALAISPHFLARPHLFSYVLIIIWLIVLLDSYDRKDFNASAPTLCALMVLWANLHGSFTFGLALLYVCAGYSCCERLVRRSYDQCMRTLYVVVAVSICALITPYGIYSALLTLDTTKLKYALQYIDEWHSPNFQQKPIHLLLFVGLFAVMAGLGIRLRGPRLIAFGMVTILALSYSRGLVLFFLLTPIILTRPLLASATWCRAVPPAGNRIDQTDDDDASDSILRYLQKRIVAIATVCLTVSVLTTAALWGQINSGPPGETAPKAAIDFVKRAGISGNVFNSYSFGGYLIFSGIPTFIDGRIPPYTDDFFRKYSETVRLVDIQNAFQTLNDYNVGWVILLPTEHLAKALAQNTLWNEVYSDKDSIVFVRR
jgi:hypothetical protein